MHLTNFTSSLDEEGDIPVAIQKQVRYSLACLFYADTPDDLLLQFVKVAPHQIEWMRVAVI
jgi:hypothetical protein